MSEARELIRALRQDPEVSRSAFGLSPRERKLVMNLFGLGPPECAGDLVASARAAGFYDLDAEALLARPRLREAIRLHLREITAPRDLLHQLSAIAEIDMGEFLVEVPVLNDKGEPTGQMAQALSISRMKEADATYMIREIDYNPKTGAVKVKLHDKLQAIRMLMNFHGMIVDRSVQAHVSFKSADDEIDGFLSEINRNRGTAANPVEVEPRGDPPAVPQVGLLGEAGTGDAAR